MSNYVKTTDFASKDTLASGNPLKTIKGTEFDVEFKNLATASATKSNLASPTFTGVPSAPTAAADTNTTQVATTAFVTTEANLKADLAGAAFTGAITTTSTFDGVDIATRDAILTSTTTTADSANTTANTANTTADAALPKAGGALTGPVTTNSTFDGVDIAVRDAILTSTTTTANAALTPTGDGSGLTGTAVSLTVGVSTLTNALKSATTTVNTSSATAPTTGQLLTATGASAATWQDAPASAVSYPQNSQSANYTLVIGDAGKSIFHPSSDTTARTFTIPANASVAFDIGAVVLFVNEAGAGALTLAITSDTFETIDGNTGTLVLSNGNILTALKITATKWLVWTEKVDYPFDYSVVAATLTAPYVAAYPWSSGGFGAKYADPSTTPTGAGQGTAFSSDGSAVAVAHTTSPYITAYPWSASGFGTKFSNPASLPSGAGTAVAFSPAGTEIALAFGFSPFTEAYPWSASGFGTKFSNPASLPESVGEDIEFSPAGTEVVVAFTLTPWLAAYPWSASG